jgi:hypothetical protein
VLVPSGARIERALTGAGRVVAAEEGKGEAHRVRHAPWEGHSRRWLAPGHASITGRPGDRNKRDLYRGHLEPRL